MSLFKRMTQSIDFVKEGRYFTIPILNRPLRSLLLFSLLYTLASLLLDKALSFRVNPIYLIALVVTPLSILALKLDNIFFSLIGDNIKSMQRSEKYRIITSGLIHADYMHLLFNLFSLFLVGLPLYTTLLYQFGWLASPIIIITFLSGIYIGSELTLRTKFGRLNPLHLGSSSGVLSILTLFVLKNQSGDLYLFGLIRFNNLTFLILFTALTFFSLFKSIPAFDMILSFSKKKINHAGHLGGILAGFLVYWSALLALPFILR